VVRGGIATDHDFRARYPDINGYTIEPAMPVMLVGCFHGDPATDDVSGKALEFRGPPTYLSLDGR
jgi:hypothetical protein